MSLQRLIVITALAALAIPGTVPQAAAQTQSSPIAAALCTPAHRDQSGAAAPSALRRLVRAAIPAERHGALSANALLVGARLTCICLSARYEFVSSIYSARHVFPGSARLDF
jgi:hypothetical protein